MWQEELDEVPGTASIPLGVEMHGSGAEEHRQIGMATMDEHQQGQGSMRVEWVAGNSQHHLLGGVEGVVAPGSGFVSKITSDPFPSSPVMGLMCNQGPSPCWGSSKPLWIRVGQHLLHSWCRTRLAWESLGVTGLVLSSLHGLCLTLIPAKGAPKPLSWDCIGILGKNLGKELRGLFPAAPSEMFQADPSHTL